MRGQLYEATQLDGRLRSGSLAPMMLAGLRVRDDDVRVLAGIVDEPIRGVLDKALELGTLIVALTIDDRERILRALDDPPDGLAELRGVLILEH